MIAGAALLGLKVNFLDFVAVPITLGISVDYSVNVVARERLGGACDGSRRPGHDRRRGRPLFVDDDRRLRVAAALVERGDPLVRAHGDPRRAHLPAGGADPGAGAAHGAAGTASRAAEQTLGGVPAERVEHADDDVARRSGAADRSPRSTSRAETRRAPTMERPPPELQREQEQDHGVSAMHRRHRAEDVGGAGVEVLEVGDADQVVPAEERRRAGRRRRIDRPEPVAGGVPGRGHRAEEVGQRGAPR